MSICCEISTPAFPAQEIEEQIGVGGSGVNHSDRTALEPTFHMAGCGGHVYRVDKHSGGCPEPDETERNNPGESNRFRAG